MPEISCTANNDFDSKKEVESSAEQFGVEAEVLPPGDGPNSSARWTIELNIHQKVAPGQNFPYEFKLVIIGLFVCGDDLPNGISKEIFVRVNGCSILYGVAREMIRATTARGPWSDLMVPTVSFYAPPAIEEAESKDA